MSSAIPWELPWAQGVGSSNLAAPTIRGQVDSKGLMTRKPRARQSALRANPPERSKDGVDLTLIRWMLSLTPVERLRAGQNFANSVLRLRASGIKA